MSKIRLHGSSSGYTEIAPVAASGNNTLTLPNDGTIISQDSNGAVGVTSVTVGTGIKLTSSKLIISGDDSGVSGNADDLIIGSTSDSTARGLTIASTTNGNIRFSDAGDNATGMIEYNHSSNYMRMYVEAGEALRIDSSSNLKFNSGFGSVETVYGVRAWADIYWNSGTPTARANGNVNSISDDGTGDMTITFSSAMPDTNYSCLVSGDDYGNSEYPGFNIGSTSRGKTTSAVSVNALQRNGSARDIAALNFAVIR